MATLAELCRISTLDHPELLPGRSNMRNARPCYNESPATVAISKSKETSHADDCRFLTHF